MAVLKKGLVFGALASIVLAAPAFAGELKKTDEAKSDPRQGAEVDSICFGRNINDFTTIKGVDNAALLRANVNDWYKVDLIGACYSSRLRFAQSVAIESHPSGGCVSKGDYLIFSSSAFGRPSNSTDVSRCAISRIYKWDRDASGDDKAGEQGVEKDPD
ncbi:MAG: DUF6491 family protein [Parvularculaceae bacterium]